MTVNTIRPDANVNAVWDFYDYTNIDDAVTEPTAGNGDEASHQDPSTGAAQIWGMADLDDTAGVTVTEVKVWMYANNGIIVGGPATVRVKVDGTWSATQNITGGWAWTSYTFAISQPAGAGEIEIEIDTQTLGKSDLIGVDVLYAVVTYTATPPATPPSATATGVAMSAGLR